jgi:hypothetical protein
VFAMFVVSSIIAFWLYRYVWRIFNARSDVLPGLSAEELQQMQCEVSQKTLTARNSAMRVHGRMDALERLADERRGTRGR